MQAPILPDGLPIPDAESESQSRRVRDYIQGKIAEAGGAISFAAFMHHALYAPGLGYYLSGSRKFGIGGDFVTAPEVSPLFGRVIARQCQAILASVASPCVLEIGAGSGVLAENVLSRLDELQALPERYLVLEASPELRSRQRERLAERLPGLVDRIEWVDAVPAGFEGVILANEVADALPVERFRMSGDGVEQLFVSSLGEGFAGIWKPASDRVQASVTDLGLSLPASYESELCPSLKPWIESLVDRLGSGIILLFDYGLPRRELYAEDRSGGWLRCHFQHRAHSEPLVLPGIQDITGWVDFSSVAEAARDAGATVAGFVTQAMFLVHGGVDAEFAELSERHPDRAYALASGLKILSLPSEMGENFKCIALTKGSVPVLSALAEADRSGSL